ncbi:MAG TPA: hypothetical protein VND41_03865 [Nitrososphaerales archaeon]|nr:hypothetical protein [Nitrososphaerales archaeon]
MSQVKVSAELAFRQLMSRLYWGGPLHSDWSGAGGARELHVGVQFANYGALTSVLVSVNGSPPKGTMLITIHPVSRTPEHVVFIARGRAKTIHKGTGDFEVVALFLSALRPPTRDPMEALR